jgi:hypothetical protein
MTATSATMIALAIWSAGLIPATLVMQWLGMVDPTWRGFLMGYAILAAVSFTYELFQRWVERRLAARRTGVTSDK